MAATPDHLHIPAAQAGAALPAQNNDLIAAQQAKITELERALAQRTASEVSLRQTLDQVSDRLQTFLNTMPTLAVQGPYPKTEQEYVTRMGEIAQWKPDEALFYKSQANLGDPVKQWEMSVWYRNPHNHIPAQPDLFFHYLNLSANGGHPFALYEMYHMCARKEGTFSQMPEEQRKQVEFDCASRSAAAGFDLGNYILSLCYVVDRGIPADQMAKRWFHAYVYGLEFFKVIKENPQPLMGNELFALIRDGLRREAEGLGLDEQRDHLNFADTCDAIHKKLNPMVQSTSSASASAPVSSISNSHSSASASASASAPAVSVGPTSAAASAAAQPAVTPGNESLLWLFGQTNQQVAARSAVAVQTVTSLQPAAAQSSAVAHSSSSAAAMQPAISSASSPQSASAVALSSSVSPAPSAAAVKPSASAAAKPEAPAAPASASEEQKGHSEAKVVAEGFLLSEKAYLDRSKELERCIRIGEINATDFQIAELEAEHGNVEKQWELSILYSATKQPEMSLRYLKMCATNKHPMGLIAMANACLTDDRDLIEAMDKNQRDLKHRGYLGGLPKGFVGHDGQDYRQALQGLRKAAKKTRKDGAAAAAPAPLAKAQGVKNR